MKKTPLILAILAIHSIPVFSQNLESRRAYFWDAESVSQFLTSTGFLTVLFIGCGIAVLLTVCSFVAERYQMQNLEGDATAQGDVPVSSDVAQLTSEHPKPACRVLQHFANLLPPVRQ